MTKLFLLVQHLQERSILASYFTQRGFDVHAESYDPGTYIRCVHFRPDVLFLEVPAEFRDMVGFLRRLKENPRTIHMPIIGYGNRLPDEVFHWVSRTLLPAYYRRPLRIGGIVDSLELALGNKLYQAVEPRMPDQRKEALAVFLDKAVTKSQRLKSMVQRVGQLMAFPITLARISQLADDNDEDVNQLVKVIQADSATATCILKAVNSPLFSARGRRISDLKEAVLRIGLLEVRNITLSLATVSLVSSDSRSKAYDRMDLWYSSLACGVASERIAARAGHHRPSEAFLAGLLHQFGILLLDEFFPEIFRMILEQREKTGSTWAEAEVSLLGFQSQELTAQLFEQWSLPRYLTDALRYHRDFLTTFPSWKCSDPTLLRAVGIGVLVVKSLGMRIPCDDQVHPVPDSLLLEMGLAEGLGAEFAQELGHALEMYNQFLNLKHPPAPRAPQGWQKDWKLGILDRQGKLFEPALVYLREILGKYVVELPPELPFDLYPKACQILVLNSPGQAELRALEQTGMPAIILESATDSDCEEKILLKRLPHESSLSSLETALSDLCVEMSQNAYFR